MKIGIIKEGKNPPDTRVPLTPDQCAEINQNENLEIVVESSVNRCFSDQEYKDAGIQVVQSINDCEILLGVKEVPISHLIPAKTYFFFSHTIKAQAYNQLLLQSILERNIRLIDYEVLTNSKGQRLIAFGKFAGMVGAHNALWTYGQRSSLFSLPRMNECKDYETVKEYYKQQNLPDVNIVLTGMGRVANGAAMVLEDMGVRRVTPQSFLEDLNPGPIFTQLGEKEYVKRKDGEDFEPVDFFSSPLDFESSFYPFTQKADIMINGIYWDNQAPAFFTREEMADESFRIQVIADVTCDIAPVSSIPSTLRASTIPDPVFGFDPLIGQEIAAYNLNGIDMMTIDNLPNELPRDASTSFGNQFMENILPELFKDKSEILERGCITDNGSLTEHFQYLSDFVKG